MKTSSSFSGWYNDNMDNLAGYMPGDWIALDANNNTIDKDPDSNRLIERIDALPIVQRRQIRVVYVFPRNFV